jgi:hypothetical protein
LLSKLAMNKNSLIKDASEMPHAIMNNIPVDL